MRDFRESTRADASRGVTRMEMPHEATIRAFHPGEFFAFFTGW